MTQDKVKWINIKKQQPEKCGYYLVLRKENPWPTTRLYQSEAWGSTATITHWMPLPQYPQDYPLPNFIKAKVNFLSHEQENHDTR